MDNHPINNMIETAMQKIREMSQSDTVVGEPVQLPNGVTAIPVCKVTVGFASGGADLPYKGEGKAFGGGAGGGVTVTPIAFLATSKDGVKLLQLDTIGTTADNIVRAVPEVIDKIGELFKGDKKGKREE